MYLVPSAVSEEQRLAALRAVELLDTPPEERFDRITRLATTFFGVPISQVTLIDAYRQWCKSVQGADLHEVAREQSFCTHTIAQRDMMIIPDTMHDELFRDNPMVLGEPHLRFYAGAPVYALDGSALGALCVMDYQPRQFGASEQQALYDLARWVEHEINTRQISQALVQHEQERRLHAMMESTREAMLLLSVDRRVLTVNRGFTDFFGVSADQLIEQPLDVLSPIWQHIFEDREEFWQVFPGLVENREQDVTMFVKQVWPQMRDLELFTAPVHADSDVYLGRLYVFRDVTHERAVERMKSEFVAQVTHELRTPLTVLQGYMDLLMDGQFGPVKPTQLDALTVMEQTVKHFGRLVFDLLDFSRLESGPIKLQYSQVNLVELLQHVIDLLRPQVDAKQQLLALQVLSWLPPVYGDVDRLIQIFQNLLLNAHQYTPSGGQIQVRLVLAGEQARIDVCDTGRGMSAEEQEQIFARFYRAQPFTDNESMGLGLTIARLLVERHNGTISVSSTLNRGSTFSVLLPFRP